MTDIPNHLAMKECINQDREAKNSLPEINLPQYESEEPEEEIDSQENESYEDKQDNNDDLNNKSRKRKLMKKAPNAPKRFKTAYICFIADRMEDVKKDMPKDCKVTDIMKVLAMMWKNLPPVERLEYERRAEDDKTRYFEELGHYSGPMQVPNKRQKKPTDAPKRSMSAFLLFSQAMRPDLIRGNPNLKNTEISSILAERWRNASEDEKKPFVEQELIEREKYHQKMKDYKEKVESEKIEAEKLKQYTLTILKQREKEEFEARERFAKQYRYLAAQDPMAFQQTNPYNLIDYTLSSNLWGNEDSETYNPDDEYYREYQKVFASTAATMATSFAGSTSNGIQMMGHYPNHPVFPSTKQQSVMYPHWTYEPLLLAAQQNHDLPTTNYPGPIMQSIPVKDTSYPQLFEHTSSGAWLRDLHNERASKADACSSGTTGSSSTKTTTISTTTSASHTFPLTAQHSSKSFPSDYSRSIPVSNIDTNESNNKTYVLYKSAASHASIPSSSYANPLTSTVYLGSNSSSHIFDTQKRMTASSVSSASNVPTSSPIVPRISFNSYNSRFFDIGLNPSTIPTTNPTTNHSTDNSQSNHNNHNSYYYHMNQQR